MISEEDLASGPGPGLITHELLCSRVSLKYKKEQRKLLTYTSEGEQRVPPLLVFSKGILYFLISYHNKSRMSQGRKDLTRPHNLHFKITEFTRRFSGRRNGP